MNEIAQNLYLGVTFCISHKKVLKEVFMDMLQKV